MSINLKHRLEELKNLNESKDKFNSKIKSQLLNEQVITESLTTFHKPVTEKIESTKQLALPEKNKSTSKPAIEENISKFKPYNILDKNINPQLQAKTLIPKFQNKIIIQIPFETIIINNKEFITFQENAFPQIFLYETSPDKFTQNTYPLTEGLENIIKGYIKNKTK